MNNRVGFILVVGGGGVGGDVGGEDLVNLI